MSGKAAEKAVSREMTSDWSSITLFHDTLLQLLGYHYSSVGLGVSKTAFTAIQVNPGMCDGPDDS